MKERVNKGLVESMGKHAAAYELNRRGFKDTFTPQNFPGIDMLAVKGTTALMVQVKATSVGSAAWMLGNSQMIPDNVICIFVDVRNRDNPQFHILRSEDLKSIQAKKQKYKKTFVDENDVYLNNWGLLDGEE